MWRISSCASKARPLASVCLKMTSFRRRSTSSSRRSVSGGEEASRRASICPCSQRSSRLSSPMFAMIRCSSLSSVPLISAWSSAANESRLPKLPNIRLSASTSASGWRMALSRVSVCSVKRASSLPSAGNAYSIRRATCSRNSVARDCAASDPLPGDGALGGGKLALPCAGTAALQSP